MSAVHLRLEPPVIPPGLLSKDATPQALTKRVLWWVGRAYGVGPVVLADLCDASPQAVAQALRALEEQGLVHRRWRGQPGDALSLTNGGLRALAESEHLSPGRLAPLLGWRVSRALWKRQGPTECANIQRPADAPVTNHRRLVYALLGRAAYESRSPDLAYWWGPALADLWLEHEVRRLIGGIGPYPDACLFWIVRRDSWLRYYLELETGSHRPNEAALKLRHYAWYAGSPACAAIWEKLPGLLFVAPDVGYETRLAEALSREQDGLQERVEVLLTNQELLEHSRLLDAVWRGPGPGRALPDERITLWGREDNEFLLRDKQARYIKRAQQKNKL